MIAIRSRNRRAAPSPRHAISVQDSRGRHRVERIPAHIPRMTTSWPESLCFPVVFQPIVHLTTGRTFGFEVLGRAPATLVDRGLPSSPLDLIAMAHREGWLLPLEHAWRRSAIAAIAAHPMQRHILYFLNVDPRILDDPGFHPGTTQSLLQRHGLPPHRFVFELTEAGAVHDVERIRAVIEHYEQQGFHIALDDVGSGFASLQALVHLRPGIVKLDQEIVRGLSRDRFRRALVEGIACFCRRSRRALIAEGIESVADLQELLDIGVPFGQGFLFGRPTTAPVHGRRSGGEKRPPRERARPCFDLDSAAAMA